MSQYDNAADDDDGKTIAQYEVIPCPERKRKEPHPPGVMENVSNGRGYPPGVARVRGYLSEVTKGGAIHQG